jgi:hypothetical protein
LDGLLKIALIAKITTRPKSEVLLSAMRRSSRSWKFEIRKLLDECIVISAGAPSGRLAQAERSRRSKLVVLFDRKPVYLLTLDRQHQEIALPFSANYLPDEIEFQDPTDGKPICAPLKIAKFLTFSLCSLTIEHKRIIGSLLSPINLPYLPVEFSMPNGRMFADGRALRAGSDAEEYYVDLPISSLVRIAEATQLDARVFGRTMGKRIEISANDIGIMGYVDVVSSSGGIAGWVCSAESSEPLLITLRVDGAPLTTAFADHPRPDLSAWNLKNLNCGFTFGKEFLFNIPTGAEISVTIGEPRIHLVNSPWELSE